MKIVNFTEPFLHTIIYDYLSDIEVERIIAEVSTLRSTFNPLDLLDPKDTHHKDLITSGNTTTFNIDQIFTYLS